MRPARIAYVTPYLLPHADASVQQFVYTLLALGRHDVAIDLLVPGSTDGRAGHVPADSELASFYGVPADSFRRLTIVPVGSAPVNGNQARGIVHGVRAAAYVRDRSYDVMYTRSWSALLPALWMKLPSVFETYRTDFNTLKRYAPWRLFCYPRPNLLGVIAHSEIARRSFIAARLPASRVRCIYNGHEPGVFAPPLAKPDARLRLGLPRHGRIVVYTGSLQSGKGTDALLSLARLLTEVQFLVVGGEPGSTSLSRFAARARAAGATNIRLIPRVAPSQVSTYLFAGDCLIIPPSSQAWAARRTVLPLKTFTYLAAGRAIVAPDLPDVREILVDGRNACLVPPDDIRAAAAGIRSLFADTPRLERLASGAQQDAAHYTWEGRARQIVDFLNSVLDATASARPHASR